MPRPGAHPIDWLRGVALSLERLAAEGVASGAVRGAADELRPGLPADLEDRLRALAGNLLTAFERLAREAAASPAPPLEAWSRTIAEGAARGTVTEFRRLVPDLQPMTQELLQRVKLWLDRSASEAAARAAEIRAPGDRARIAAAGAIAGAAEQLGLAMPVLAAPAAELASEVGRGFVRGTAEELGRQVRRLGRSRAAPAAILGGCAVLAFLLGGRRR